MLTNNTTQELESEVGKQLRAQRLRLNIDQRQLAAQAGVALNVIKNLEGGKGATLTSLIKVLRALGRTDWLHSLAPPVTISPLQIAQSKVVRKRAFSRRKAKDV